MSVHMTGQRRIPVVGAYIPPADTNTLAFIQQALDRFPMDSTPILLGDLNIKLATPTTAREIEIATLLASVGLTDMLPHFRQRSKLGKTWAWSQQREGARCFSRKQRLYPGDQSSHL